MRIAAGKTDLAGMGGEVAGVQGECRWKGVYPGVALFA